MSSEKIKEFYTKLAADAEFRNDVAKLNLRGEKDLSEKNIEKIVREIILPYSRRLGYNFSEKELLEFENLSTTAKEKLHISDLEEVSGGGFGLWALLMAALTLIPGGNTLGTSDVPTTYFGTAGAAVNEAVPEIPNWLEAEAHEVQSAEPEFYSEQNAPTDELITKDITAVDASGSEEAPSHEDFLKIMDGSDEVNATALLVHNTMEANDTWALSADQLEKANAEAPQNEVQKVIKKLQTLGWIQLPTDKAGLEAYLKVEPDKFAENQKGFLELLGTTDLAKAADMYCEALRGDGMRLEGRESRNISRETILEVKKTLLLELNKKYPEALESSQEEDSRQNDIEQKLAKIENTDEKEAYLDEKLNKIKDRVSDYDRAKVVHDWVAENIAYNHADYMGPEVCEGSFRNHAEQVFKNKRGVCRGYAHLTELMMRVVGVPCAYVSSYMHAFNAIFINDEWFLIDTNLDAYKKVNEHLFGLSRKTVPANYKENPNYNKVIEPNEKKEISQDNFPASGESADKYNKYFVAGNVAHNVKHAWFHFNGESGICEIGTNPSTFGGSLLLDATKECLVDGKLTIPDEIASQVNGLLITDREVLKEIKKFHIPKNLELESLFLPREYLKNMDEVTVDPASPYYDSSTGLVWDKNSGEILWRSKDKVHISKDFPDLLSVFTLIAELADVKEVTVDPDNPYYTMYTSKKDGKTRLYKTGESLSLDIPLWTKPDEPDGDKVEL